MKQRLVGAAVLMALGVIFIPIFLAPDDSDTPAPSAIQIARDAPNEQFSSKVQPITDEAVQTLNEQVDAAGALPGRGVLPPEVQTENLSNAAQDFNRDGIARNQSQMENTQSPTTSPETISGQTSAEPVAKDTVKERTGVTAWVVQAGSFSSRENAQKLSTQLKEKGYTAYIEDIVADKTSYRVRIGPLLSKARAQQTVKSLKKSLQVEGMILKYH